MTPPKPSRGEQVPPPPSADEWEVRYATKESLALPEVEKQFPGTVEEAKQWMRRSPLERSPVCKKLRGSLGTRLIRGEPLPQWQYDISSAGRIWYCPDERTRTVWITNVSAGHPGATSRKNKRGRRNR